MYSSIFFVNGICLCTTMGYLVLYFYRVTFIILTDSSAANLADTLVVVGFDPSRGFPCPRS